MKPRNDYFKLVVGQLKLHEFIYLAQGSGGYEVWKRFSRHVTVPNRCVSRHAANGVMQAAGIRYRFPSEQPSVAKANFPQARIPIDC